MGRLKLYTFQISILLLYRETLDNLDDRLSLEIDIRSIGIRRPTLEIDTRSIYLESRSLLRYVLEN